MVKACSRIVLALLLASALLGLSSPIGAAGGSPQKQPKSASAADKGAPVTVWSIDFTSTNVESGEKENAIGSYVENYTYTNSGSMLYNIYADGSIDNTDFKIQVADDFTSTDTTVCTDQWDHVIGHAPSHSHVYNTNPDYYDVDLFAVNPWAVVPAQNEDGSWWALFDYGLDYPFQNYTGIDHEYGSDCGGPAWDTTSPADELSWNDLCFPISIEGNADGTEFDYHAEGTDLKGCEGPNGWRANLDGTDQVRWTVDVKVKLLAARDLTIDKLEVTQGLQDGANSIPLVQGRSTVVRAFVDIGTDPGPIDGVTGTLEGFAGGVKLGSVDPFNPNGVISAPKEPDWKNINDTLNFALPLAWTKQPSLTLKVTVNPGRRVVESNYDNNDLSVDKSTRACNTTSIVYTPIHYAPPNKTPADPSANIQAGQKFMQKIYPIADNGIIYKPYGAMILLQDINSDKVDIRLLNSLIGLLLISNPPPAQDIFGWLPSLAYTDNGLGNMRSSGAFGNDTEAPSRWRRTFAHEIGHNFGLDHPDPPLSLTTNGDHWFDVYDRVIKPVPATVGSSNLLDMMEPDRLESEAWISPTNYLNLMNALCPVAAAAAPTRPNPATVGDNLVISGIVGNTTPATGSLDPLFRNNTVATTTLPVGSQYCVNFEDDKANLLSDYCFDANFEDDSATPASAATFGMVVPYPVGLYRAELVQISTGDVLSSWVARAQPSVTVTYPNAAGLTLSGYQTITWNGSDPNGDPLTYDVFYSNDAGQTWMGIGANITGTSYSVDFSSLPGSHGIHGAIKVMVSNGLKSAHDQSDNLFTVGNKPPSASILSPSSGATFYTGSQVALEGSGVDLEDGSLGDSALSWVSSKDGVLGTGQELEVNLSPGVHTITLTVTDSNGLQDTDSIQLTVIQSVIPNPSNYNLFLPLIER